MRARRPRSVREGCADMSMGAFTRRTALTGAPLALVVSGKTTRAENPSAVRPITADDSAGPIFSRSGPNAELYGEAEGYPVSDPSLAQQPGDPYKAKYRVGAYSHFDAIYPTRRIERAPAPSIFKREKADIRYFYWGNRSSIEEYLARNPVTGLLVAKDDRILCEHYQYGRTDKDRLASQSMAKSLIGALIGIAVGEGAIRSVDDQAAAYLPGLDGTEYGRTSIRDLLHMSSGVEFGEEREGSRDLNRLWIDMVLGWGRKGTVASIAQFDRRIAPPATKYSYASIEPDVLGLVLRSATGKSASLYLQEKIWQPIGAEADAAWVIDAEGIEVVHGFFNAVMRDYARLGRLLAHDGAWEGRELIPRQWMIDATTVRPTDDYLAPGKAMPTFGYGYLIWLLPGARRQFALVGARGHRICVDPASKLVMVHLAVDEAPEAWQLWSALVEQFGA